MQKEEKQRLFEKNLINACKNNDRKAQFKFYQLYSAKLLGICYRFAGDYDTANDLLQEAFIRIFKHLHLYRFEGSFDGWLKKIAVRTSIDYLKKHKLNELSELDTSTEPIAPPNISEQYDVDFIMNEIAKLPTGFRTILNLYAIEGYSYPEIAAMLDIKEVTVRSQYVRAKQKLADTLKNKYPIDYATKII